MRPLILSLCGVVRECLLPCRAVVTAKWVVSDYVYPAFEFEFDDRLYSAILRSLEQTHCARMWFCMSD